MDGVKKRGFARKFVEYGNSGDSTESRLVDNLRSFETAEHFNSRGLKMTIKSTLSGSPFIKNMVRIAKQNGV